MRALVFVVLAACAGNVTRIKDLHVPEGSTDTRDKSIATRVHRTIALETALIDNDFPGGAFVHVREGIEITIAPENEPINDSAWYAFRISSRSGAREVSITLRYEGGTHRYTPKTSTDGVTWTTLDAITVATDKKSATLRLQISETPLFVAAQEIITSVTLSCGARETIGTSVGGRALELVRIGEGKERIVILGRQHPPEVTGTLALQSFVEAICENTAFRARYETIVIPLVNPDGVADGHWRHNLHGIDLNRDWAHFRQPETRAIKDALAGLSGVAFALDFHSTFKDVFYVLPEPTPLVTDWIAAIAKRLPTYQYRVQPVTLDVPAGTIWIHRALGIPTVAYEVGDETPRGTLREIARVAADELMRLLLARPSR